MLVNEEGQIVNENDTQPPIGDSTPIGDGAVATTNEVDVAEPVPMSREHEEFLAYEKRIRKRVTIPQPTEDDFCAKMRAFIETRGDGLASGEQVIEAYNLFQNHCVEKKKEEGDNAAVVEGSNAVVKGGDEPAVTPVATPAVEGNEGLPAANADVPPIINEYVDRDSKLTTFDDDLGVRPNSDKKIRKITDGNETENNKNPYLFFLVILGIATMVYAINKKD